MYESLPPDRFGTTDDVIRSISDSDRRHCLSVLRDLSGELSVELLARKVAATSDERSPAAAKLEDSFGKGYQRVRARLIHEHLPMLSEAGLVAWNRSEGTVETADHPALSDPQFWEMVETEASGWDDVLDALSDASRRLALSVLAADGDGTSRGELVRRSLALEEGVPPSAIAEEAVDRATIRYHHNHLPKLQQAGLIEYDGETVTYRGHPALRTDRLADGLWDASGAASRVVGRAD